MKLSNAMRPGLILLIISSVIVAGCARLPRYSRRHAHTEVSTSSAATPPVAPPEHLASYEVKSTSFDYDPGWDGQNNRYLLDHCKTIVQDVRYRNGEIGGQFTRSMKDARYAVPIS